MNNTLKNVTTAILSKIIAVFGPFVIRTLIIYKLGNEYVGLSSLFTSILQVLSLAELGIGSVLTFSMYRPVVEKDVNKLRILLNFYKIIYRLIGMVIIGVAVILTPFIPKLINGSVPDDINIYILFWIYIANTSVSYLLFAYRSAVLIANKRNDIVYLIDTATKLLMYIIQAIVLCVIQDFFVYIIFMPISTVVNNIVVYYLSVHYYPDIYPEGKLQRCERKEIFIQLESLCIHRVAGVLILSLDNIVISAVLGLDVLAIYSNYSYVVTAVIGFLDAALTAITSIVGTNLVRYSDEEKYESFKKAALFYSLTVSLCTLLMFNMFQPFIELWIGKKNMLTFFEMACFCLYFYSYKFRSILMTYRDAAGLWRQDVWKSIIGLVINLVGNIVLINIFGAVGVLIATIIIMVVLFYPWETYVLFKYLFKRSPKDYLIITFKISVMTVLSIAISYLLWLIPLQGNLITLAYRAIISILVFGVLVITFFKRRCDFENIKNLTLKMIRR